MYVLLPILGQHFGLSYGSIGLIRAAHSSAMSLLEFPAGVLSERFGQRRLLVFGLLCGGLGYLSLSLAVGFESLLLALFLTGVGAAFQHSLCSSLISSAFDTGGRRVALGAYNSSGDVGKLVATGAMSALVGMGLGWRSVSAGYGVLALLGAGLLVWVLRQYASSPNLSLDPTSAGTHSIRASGIKDRIGFRTLAAVVFLDTMVQDGFLVFVAFLMIEKGVSPGLAAFAVVLTLLGGIAGKFGCGHLSERLGMIRSLVIVQVSTAVGIACVVFSSSLVAYCLLPLVGIFLQGSTSISYPTVGDFVEQHRSSRGFAIIYSMSALAAILAPVLFGLAADHVGLAPAVLAMAVVVLLTLPLCLVLEPALRRVSAS